MKKELVPDEEERKKFSYPKKKQVFPVDDPNLLKTIFMYFDISTKELKAMLDVETLILQMLEIHSRPIQTLELVQSLLVQVLSYHQILFKSFAVKLPYFHSLKLADRQMLIDKNCTSSTL